MVEVSIIIPLYNPDKSLIKKIKSALNEQDYKKSKEVLFLDLKKGLADTLNEGIKMSKGKIIVSLHQDCVPSSKKWLSTLVAPLKNKNVLASVSKVELPKELWLNFDLTSKILSSKEQKVLTPLMDEKGCAYKKELFSKVGLFDGETYRTAGEDFDMYLRIKQVGDISYPEAKVIHFHKYTWKKRLKKEYQLSNAFNLPRWYVGVLKSIPLLGYLFFIPNIEPSKLKWLSLFAIFIYFPVSLIYSLGFWKGFLKGRQTL
jgi:GT2 family glycosyltransferase